MVAIGVASQAAIGPRSIASASQWRCDCHWSEHEFQLYKKPGGQLAARFLVELSRWSITPWDRYGPEPKRLLRSVPWPGRWRLTVRPQSTHQSGGDRECPSDASDERPARSIGIEATSSGCLLVPGIGRQLQTSMNHNAFPARSAGRSEDLATVRMNQVISSRCRKAASLVAIAAIADTLGLKNEFVAACLGYSVSDCMM